MDNCGHAGAVFVFECGSVGRPSKNNQSRINSSNMFHQLTHISTLEIFFGKWLIEGTKLFNRIFLFFCFGELKKSDIKYILQLWFIEPVLTSLCLVRGENYTETATAADFGWKETFQRITFREITNQIFCAKLWTKCFTLHPTSPLISIYRS